MNIYDTDEFAVCIMVENEKQLNIRMRQLKRQFFKLFAAYWNIFCRTRYCYGCLVRIVSARFPYTVQRWRWPMIFLSPKRFAL